ncbi:MAG: Adenine phosphoribosyltransferase [uncultured bacterium]|nr:MAG: Adenine phosphoribosyltransferase [uncultured bacterium]
MNLKSKIRTVLDFPQKGINFYDITTILQDAKAHSYVIDKISSMYSPDDVDIVVGTESRGFIFGAPIAYKLRAGFVPVRKKGKLPYKTVQASYEKEYGPDVVEIHEDAIKPNQKVLIVDDLLATGGTISAAKCLIEKLGGKIVGFVFLIELTSLGGRKKLKGYKVDSVLKFKE